jgi:hypothetical protein
MNTYPLEEQEADLAYYSKQVDKYAKRGDCENAERWRKRLHLLHDAVIIYHERRGLDPDVLNLVRFGFTVAEAKAMVARQDKYHIIPASLLVQIFMRKFQNDLDRRRP